MKIIAIDPGMSGAYAVLEVGRSGSSNSAVDLLAADDLPTMGDGPKREINGASLYASLAKWEAERAFIENVFAMPSIPDEHGIRRGMGAASAFKFGMGVGALRAVVQCLGIHYRLIVPAVWKKHFGLKGSDKEPSRQEAIRRFPYMAERFTRKMDHQRAEAALIGLCGVEKFLMQL